MGPRIYSFPFFNNKACFFFFFKNNVHHLHHSKKNQKKNRRFTLVTACSDPHIKFLAAHSTAVVGVKADFHFGLYISIITSNNTAYIKYYN